MVFFKRKGTGGVKHFPEDFEEIKLAFNKVICYNIKQFNIPDEMILKLDQTGVNPVLCGKWTLHDTGKILFTFLFKYVFIK